MKLDTMEGRVGSQDLLPGKHHKHYDVIRANSSGGILLGTSNRTSRHWLGSLWYYNSDQNLLDSFQCASAVSIESGVNDIAWIGDKVIVAGLDTGVVASWRVNTNEEAFTPLWQAREHDHLVRAVSAYEQENRVVTASYDGTVKVWDVEDDIGNCSRTYRGHSDIIHSVDHHQSAPLFVTCSMDGYVIVWDCRQPKPAKRYAHFAQKGPVCAAWQPGTDSLAVGDSLGQVHFGDLEHVENLLTYRAHTDRLTCMQFSACGTMLATGSQDCEVRVLKPSGNGQFQEVYSKGHQDYVRSLTWCRGSEVVSCSYDGQILRHQISASSMDVNGDKDDSPEEDH